ncbi:MAG: methyltransferase domain-containing protein, partial [Chloroflexi bacterium]|nr:methyltransferase domain-containing protein [Chloroflexota bacterium]
VAGALTETDYRAKLASAGFDGIDLEVLKGYDLEDVPEKMRCCLPKDVSLPEGTRIISAFIRAGKPGEGGGKGTEGAEHGRAGETPALPGEANRAGETPALPGESRAGGTPALPGKVKSYFKGVATRWDGMRQSYFTEEVREAAIARANLAAGSVVADVGTGTGFMLAGLAPLVKKAHGFDNSPEMLEIAKKNLAGAANVELQVSEGDRLPLPDAALDAAFANMYLHHAPDPSAAISELARVLKPGGRLVITDLDKHDHGWMAAEMADVWMGFDRDRVAEWFRSAELSDVKVECTGSDCCGTSAGGDRASISVFVASGTKAP